MKTVLAFLLSISLLVAVQAQTIKKAAAVRTDKAPKIDGLLNDAVWQKSSLFTDFVELKPVPGKTERPGQRTEVRILYDDVAIYVAARMLEEEPDSIAREIAPRDQVGNADFFGVVFDTYLDRINANGFFVTSAGSQFDAKYSQSGNEDPNWNAVWESDVKIDAQGWTVEMKIPYSALRFSNKSVQTWGINMTRSRRNANQQLFWNPLDPAKNGFINQEGELENLQDIKSPVRLSFSPYVSSYMNHYPFNQPGVKNTSGSFNGGMDVKYGINESFTLDMTLVPDFGQVRSDNQVLNLSPYEVRFDERRQFFTEGTELFNQADLFYSRRIGSRPLNYYAVEGQLQPNEHIVDNPTESRLLNATKISGRTAKGLGIGFFNAVTKKMEAIVENDLGERRFIQTQPLTNYNVMVLDQSLKNNSSVSLINTNVTRAGAEYDANVSALLFNLNDKKIKYQLSGGFGISRLTHTLVSNGFAYVLRFGKQSGTFTWNVFQSGKDDQFDPNDMGIQFTNNFIENGINMQYSLYKPGKWYNQWQNWFNVRYLQRFKPNTYQSSGMELGTWVQFKNFWSANINTDYQFDGNDYWEPRVDGKVYQTGSSYGINFSMNSNRAKKYNGGAYFAYRVRSQFGGTGYGYGFFQNYRVNNKLALGVDLSVEPRLNYVGFAKLDENSNDIIFSTYDRHTVESSFDVKYTFTPRMGLTFIARHYWSDRRNKAFYTLEDNGELSANPAFDGTGTDRNFNTFNIDMVYTWQFAPGSELSLSWKDAVYTNSDILRPGYFNNFNRTLSSPQDNTVSVKLLYYLDFLQLKRKNRLI